MNLATLAAQDEVDPVSGIHVNILTFIFYYALEIDVFFLRTSDTVLQRYKSTLLHDYGNAEVRITGSMAEGLFLPVDFNNGDFISIGDFDLMFLLKGVNIRDKCHYNQGRASSFPSVYTFVHEVNEGGGQRDESCKPTCVISEKNSTQLEPYLNVERWSTTHEGYIMLRRCRPDQSQVVQESLDRMYVNSLQCVKAHAEELNKFQKDTSERMPCRPDFGSNSLFSSICNMGMDPYMGEFGGDPFTGATQEIDYNPVFEFQEKGPSAYSAMQGNPYTSSADIEHDNVLGLPHPGWPDSASEWITRNSRTSGWPSRDMITEIFAKGCHFVAVGHPDSKVKDYEFRLSFSMAELVLARSFSRAQRAIVLIFKAFLKTMLPRASALSSYQIKTVMFWMSEEVHPQEWKMEKLGGLLLDVLDRWIGFLKDKNLPNYFVRKNNMISHKEDTEVSAAIDQLTKIRRDPVSALDSLKSYMRLSFTRYVDLKDVLFRPLLQENQRNVFQEPEKVIQVIEDFGKLHLENKHFEAALVYFEEGIKFYVEQKSGGLGSEVVPLVSLAADTCHKLCNIIDGIRHHEMLVDVLSREDISEKAHRNNLAEAFGVLAKLYHIYSKRIEDAEVKQQYLTRAGDSFRMSFTMWPDHIYSLIYYGNYLIEESQYEEAIPLLRRVLDGNHQGELHLKSCDAEIFDTHVQEIIEQYLQEIEVPALSVAYYLLHECFVQTGHTTEAADVLGEFEYSESCKLGVYTSIVFLGHSYLKTSNPEKGRELIETTRGSKSVYHSDKLEEKLKWVEHVQHKMAQTRWENSKLAALLKP